MAVYARARALMEAELGDDLVALDPEGGECFGFNSVAASVWKQLAEPKTFEEMRDALVAEFEIDAATCETELRELLDDLTAKGLIVRRT